MDYHWMTGCRVSQRKLLGSECDKEAVVKVSCLNNEVLSSLSRLYFSISRFLVCCR
jgi:hypothetical protein